MDYDSEVVEARVRENVSGLLSRKREFAYRYGATAALSIAVWFCLGNLGIFFLVLLGITKLWLWYNNPSYSAKVEASSTSSTPERPQGAPEKDELYANFTTTVEDARNAINAVRVDGMFIKGDGPKLGTRCDQWVVELIYTDRSATRPRQRVLTMAVDLSVLPNVYHLFGFNVEGGETTRMNLAETRDKLEDIIKQANPNT